MAPARRANKARAKVNLSLRIAGRRPDGYHELESLVVFPDTGDGLTAEPAPDLTLDIEGPFADGLTDEADNLVLRAARALRAETGCGKGASIVLDKWLPVASGIGGGSADAAAALHLLNDLWETGLDGEALARIGLGLGADVPVCLDAAPAFMTGIGERVARLPALPDFVLLLVNPGMSVATGEVFARLDAAPVKEDREATPPPSFAMLDALLQWLARHPNDLEAPAMDVAPAIGLVLRKLDGLPGALLSRMSGSGATCFAIFSDRNAAQDALSTLSADCPDWWCVAAPVVTG
ncbi:4-diphosphocytidyl-2-C-methyl-D-erythritol kinase [Parvibaculum indicum]|uniref:4-(cytidine 5'-diphospho)-2-C-methyl-D-erythritol kinase n=1 Tax=Parvibaculum indicum TaxID=562969 RepID=UPI001421DAFD|nr:4-(cytidine 5'-diphospho)-2-C-methyl-D-erythritol kinase [Parvibaculum indicum]NIJ41720.1 4-diphosphocytidyl-2-C-methyl-D-erythritol kinase [Parvibaculum indicum]